MSRVHSGEDDRTSGSHSCYYKDAVQRKIAKMLQVESDRADIKQRLDQVGQHDARGTLQAQKTLLKDGRFTVVHLAAAVLLTFVLTYIFL